MKQDYTNITIHYLTFQHYVHTNKSGQQVWKAICNRCGGSIEVSPTYVKNGNTKSCGCLNKRKRNNWQLTTHGKSQTKAYKTWAAMKQRCLNVNHTYYHNYGGRGIKVCKRWLTFENFFADMGDRPPNLTLDRINNEGNYCKSNCRWASHEVQGKNRRKQG